MKTQPWKHTSLEPGPLFSTKWIWKVYELLFYFWHFVEGMWVCSASAWCGRPSFCSVSSFITAKMAPQKWVWVPSFCSTWQPWGLPLVSDFVEALFCFFAGFLICNYKMAVPNPTRSIGGGIVVPFPALPTLPKHTKGSAGQHRLGWTH